MLLLSLGCRSGAVTGGDPGAQDVLHAPVLETATARASGRLGHDLRIGVRGSDPDGDAVGLSIRVLARTGDEVLLFDSDFDGFPDSGQAQLPFDAPVAASPDVFDASATILGALNQGVDGQRVEVALVDGAGRLSALIVSDVADQPVRVANAACDPTFVTDRCADNLTCWGTPPICQRGEPPTITQIAYFEPTNPLVDGPRLLIGGTEPENDLRVIHLDFMDETGNPVFIDLNGDGAPDGSTFDVDATAASTGGQFFVELALGLGAQDLIQRIAAVPEDYGANVGERIETALTMIVVRTISQACDPLGFDACATGAVCMTSASGASTCQAEGVERTQECAQAPLLVLEQGRGFFSGTTEGASLWDPPGGCSSNNPRGRPESVVLLSLNQGASRVIITTDTPNTNFDTIVYVLNPCTSSGSLALACDDDDAQTIASTVEMQGVPAGTYAIVIDSFGSAGGVFGIEVTVE